MGRRRLSFHSNCSVVLLLMLLLGVVSVPGGVGGFLLGSILIKRLSLSAREQIRAMFFLAIVGLGSMLMYAVQCDTAPLADVATHQRAGLTYT